MRPLLQAQAQFWYVKTLITSLLPLTLRLSSASLRRGATICGPLPPLPTSPPSPATSSVSKSSVSSRPSSPRARHLLLQRLPRCCRCSLRRLNPSDSEPPVLFSAAINLSQNRGIRMLRHGVGSRRQRLRLIVIECPNPDSAFLCSCSCFSALPVLITRRADLVSRC